MNDWERLRRQAQRYKENYPPGTRVMLLILNSICKGSYHPEVRQVYLKFFDVVEFAIYCREYETENYKAFYRVFFGA